MIKELEIHNFKCFQRSPVFEFSKINLLTGINGRGKSSLLQSLLLIAQSVNKVNELQKLQLNGRYVQLGNYDDIKNSDTPRGENIFYEIKFEDPNICVKMNFKENEADSLSAIIESKKIEVIDEIEELKSIDKKIDDFKKSFGVAGTDVGFELKDILFSHIMSRIHYISADRLGPVKYVDKTSLSDFINVGPKGENTINILANDSMPLVHENLYKGQDAKTLIQQTEEWLGYILEGAKIDIKGKDKESSVLYMLLNNKKNSYSYKPFNVGFGYSYILPLVVSGLIAQKGDTLIVENPEAHLHPRAQSKITEFFARVASCGVQVFIESHSEHILNGLRVSALNPEIGIKHDELTIQYFNEVFDPVKLIMDDKGKIANWPEGFFDQQEVDLANIFKHSK